MNTSLRFVSVLLVLAAGPQAQVRLVRDILPGALGSAPHDLVELNGRVYFVADGSDGARLWASDGTAAGTVALTGPIQPADLSPSVDGLYFTALSSGQRILWSSRGTPGSTAPLSSGFGRIDPRGLTRMGDSVLFSADGGEGRELYIVKGFAVRPVKDINQGPASSDPRQLGVVGSLLYFAADDGSGHEPWMSDGTEAGTLRIKDLRPGPQGSDPAGFVGTQDGSVFFSANDGVVGREPYKIERPGSPPVLAADIAAGAASSNPRGLTVSGDKVYMAADDGQAGDELVIFDLVSQTHRVDDINPGPASSSPRDIVPLGGRVLFSAEEPGAGREPYQSDGTPQGTAILKDIHPGAPGSNPEHLTIIGADVFFAADDGQDGVEPWRTDGRPLGTFKIQNIEPGGGSHPAGFTLASGKTYFAAARADVGRELWEYHPGPTAQDVHHGFGGDRGVPALRASTPRIGTTMALAGFRAPSSSLAAVLLALRAPVPLPLGGDRYAYVDLATAFPLFTFTTAQPEWGLPVFVPNDPSLAGAGVATQVFYIKLGPGDLAGSNGVVLWF